MTDDTATLTSDDTSSVTTGESRRIVVEVITEELRPLASLN